MKHPLDRVPVAYRGRLFILLLVMTFGCTFALGRLGKSLETSEAPNGILSFEFAGDSETAQRMIESWQGQAMADAWRVQNLDLLYPLLYSTTQTLACLWVANLCGRHNWQSMAGGANFLAWGQWTSAIFDYIENFAIYIMFSGTVESPWPEVSWYSASVKFILIALGLLCTLLGVILWTGEKLSKPSASRNV